jgi:excisionase family DNA binding protein
VPKSYAGTGWMSVSEVARELGLINRTVYRLIDEGQLVAYRLGRVIRCKRSDVEAYLEANRIKPGDLRHLYPADDGDAAEGT